MFDRVCIPVSRLMPSEEWDGSECQFSLEWGKLWKIRDKHATKKGALSRTPSARPN